MDEKQHRPMRYQIGQTRPYGKKYGLSEIVRALKSFSARRINKNRNTPGIAIWQQNYFERIIRNEKELDQIRLYIMENPHQWDEDEENPGNM
jgi:REP element-mobilizing transposase RayT